MIKDFFLLYFLIMCSIFLLGIEKIDSLKEPHATFLSKENILFISYSEKWDEKKLEALYKELLKNGHGEEIYHLNQVRLEKDVKRKKDSEILGTYNLTKKTISLYNADKKESVDSLSHTLSHEYGHHFMYYWLPSQHDKKSDWAKIRKLDDLPIEWKKNKKAEHKWLIGEVLAEEYIYFYGAQNRKTKDIVKIKKIDNKKLFYMENSKIPHPSTNKKLQKFWEKKTKVKTTNDSSFSSPKLINEKENDFGYIFTFSKAHPKKKKSIVYMYEYQFISNVDKTKKRKKFYLYENGEKFSVYIPKGKNTYDYLFIQVHAIDPGNLLAYRSPVYWYDLKEKQPTLIKRPKEFKDIKAFKNEFHFLP